MPPVIGREIFDFYYESFAFFTLDKHIILVIYSYHPPHARGVLQDAARRGEGAAPAVAARNRDTGRPRVAVRPY
jgi:hypothetical protein